MATAEEEGAVVDIVAAAVEAEDTAAAPVAVGGLEAAEVIRVGVIKEEATEGAAPAVDFQEAAIVLAVPVVVDGAAARQFIKLRAARQPDGTVEGRDTISFTGIDPPITAVGITAIGTATGGARGPIARGDGIGEVVGDLVLVGDSAPAWP